MDSTLLSGIMGLAGALIGAVIGGVFSYRASKSATQKNIDAQNNAIAENRELEEIKMKESIATSAKIIYWDLLTAIDEGVKTIKESKINNNQKPPKQIPINRDYIRTIANISNEIKAEELFSINKAYGMIEKIRETIIFSV